MDQLLLTTFRCDDRASSNRGTVNQKSLPHAYRPSPFSKVFSASFLHTGLLAVNINTIFAQTFGASKRIFSAPQQFSKARAMSVSWKFGQSK